MERSGIQGKRISASASAAAAAMAPSAASALRGALLLLLALSLSFPSAVESNHVPNLCHLPKHAVPGLNCAAIRCLRYDPVCGVNGVTYGCGCVVANCYAVRVVKLGEC